MTQGGQDTPARLIDSTGTVVQKYEYDAYGKATVITLGTGGYLNPYRWKGMRYDPETGLGYRRNRYYSFEWGRFMTRDPLGAWADGFNWGNGYAYTGCNPGVRSDIFGLQAGGRVYGSDARQSEGGGQFEKWVVGVQDPRDGERKWLDVTDVVNNPDNVEALEGKTFDFGKAGFDDVAQLIEHAATNGNVRNFAWYEDGAANVIDFVSDELGPDGRRVFVGALRTADVALSAGQYVNAGRAAVNVGLCVVKAVSNSQARRILRNNLKLTDKNLHAHHIVPLNQGGKLSLESRGILSDHGIDINSAMNGAAMRAECHTWIHSKYGEKYDQWVLDMLREGDKRGKAGVLEALEEIKGVLEGLR
jgi:RHS repeat-associated protein